MGEMQVEMRHWGQVFLSHKMKHQGQVFLSHFYELCLHKSLIIHFSHLGFFAVHT